MILPFFYTNHLPETAAAWTLDEPTSKHIVQVLRMKAGDKIQLTNGKGFAATAEILNPHKKDCVVTILSSSFHPLKVKRKIGIAISPLKNSSRYEWFLEKATELGVSDIYPLLCNRTEREYFRYERMHAICISAMLQSQQTWLPLLHQPVNFQELVDSNAYDQKWIAHCTADEKVELAAAITGKMKDGLILIGPEGDFTSEEITLALDKGFKPVALGNTRLRTETAGIIAATLLVLCQP